MKYSIITLPILGAIISLSANARVYEYQFTDTMGMKKNIYETQQLVNPTSAVTALVIAGLDLKASVTLTNKAGELLYSSTTGYVTTSDRMIAATDGRELYGKKVTLPIISDDIYEITTTLIDRNGVSQPPTKQTLIVDTTPPTANPLSVPKNPGYSAVITGNKWILGLSQETTWKLSVDKVSDANGIKNGYLTILRQNGDVYSTTEMSFDEGAKAFSIPFTKGGMKKSDHMPESNAEEVFTFVTTIYDRAGNKTELPHQNFLFDSLSGDFTVFAVYDPNATSTVVPGNNPKYVPYKAGMTVHTNPIQFIVRIARDNYRPYNHAGLTVNGGSTAYEDNDYVYVKVNISNGRPMYVHNAYQYGGWFPTGPNGSSGHFPSYSVVLSDSVPPSPSLVGKQLEFLDQYNEWIYVDNTRAPVSTLPLKFSKVRFTVSPRPYDQVVVGPAQCNVPAGGTTCEAAYNFATGDTHGYVAFSATPYNAEKTVAGITVEKRLMWNIDFPPTITGYNYDESSMLLNVYINQPGNGSWRDQLILSKSWLEEKKTGSILKATGTKIGVSADDYTYQFDLHKLDEGSYDIVIKAQDTFLNTASLDFKRIVVDNTPPNIDFKFKDANLGNGDTVYGLENISIILSDTLTVPSIVSLKLSGGPTADDVELGYTKTAENTYRPEYPRIFPSLENKDSYTLTVIAKDSSGNKSTKTASFKYFPNNLVTLERLTTLGVNVALRTSSNAPLAVLESSTLRKEDGSLITGVQKGTFTVRSDASFPVVFLGTTIAPGETKDVAIDLGTGSGVSIPIFPAISGKTGTADFIIEIPQFN